MTDSPKKHGGKRPGSGRKRGTPNKVTVELKGMAQQYTEQAIQTLAEVMQDPEAPAQARISAASALLDRGHGKPAIAIEVEASVKTDAELLKKLDATFSERMAAARERQRKVLIERGIIKEGEDI